MINEPSNSDFTPKKHSYSDYAIFYGMLHSKFWSTLFKDYFLAIYIVVVQFCQFTRATLKFTQSCLFRSRFGIASCGYVQSFSAVTIMVIFNSEHVWPVFAPFVFLAAPILPFFYDWSEIYSWIFEDYKSLPLLIMSCSISLLSIFHVTMAYIGMGNIKMTSQGKSHLHLLLSRLFAKKRISVSEEAVAITLESGIIIMIGSISWFVFEDITFGSWCYLMAFAEISTHVKAVTARMQRRSYLDT